MSLLPQILHYTDRLDEGRWHSVQIDVSTPCLRPPKRTSIIIELPFRPELTVLGDVENMATISAESFRDAESKPF
jgi:hypothetical protein